MEFEATVADYVEQVTGERPEILPVAAEAADRLPLYLGRAWDLRKMVLFGQELVLALPKGGTRTGLARLVKDCAVLAFRLESEVIAVIPDIRSYERRQLVQKRVPFVTPGRQLFLPMFLADFRETFSVPAKPKVEAMSWVSQLIVLRHLLNGGITERPLAEVAGTLGYSAMAVTHGVKELIALNLCTKVPKGRAKTIKFNFDPAALWEHALEHMRSPVVRRYSVAVANEKIPKVLDAGLTALSAKTNLAYGGLPIMALPNREVRRLFADKSLEKHLEEEDGEFVLEGWSYSPQVLSDGPEVDELSLFLSLKDDMDERIQRALTDMMERRTW